MGRRQCGAGLLVTGVLLLGLSATARADDAPEQPIRIQYVAPDGCPDSLSFFLHVRARTQHVRLAAPGELAALVSVAITTENGGSVGTLEMPDAEGKPFTRRVEATSCEEVSLALSLVLALAYDPDAITTFPESPAQTAAPAPTPPPAPPAVVAPPPPPASPAQPSPFALAFGMDALLMSGVAPGLSPVFAPFVEYGSARDDGWTPRFSAALLIAPDRQVATRSGLPATLQFVGLRLLGCPASAELAGAGLAVSPCLSLDGGRIYGSGGERLDVSHTGGIYWLSVAGLARVRWKIVEPLFVEAFGGGGPTIVHRSFTLHSPEAGVETVHAVPDFFGEVGLGAGMHFP